MRQKNTPLFLLCLLCLALGASGQTSKNDDRSLILIDTPAITHALQPFMDDIFIHVIHHSADKSFCVRSIQSSKAIFQNVSGTEKAIEALLRPSKSIAPTWYTDAECTSTSAISSKDGRQYYSRTTFYTI